MKTLIFATGNTHKISEAAGVIDSTKYIIKSLSEVDINEEIAETGVTLEENALIKARYVASIRDEIVFSEDTGLEVDALDGAPGVYTARYGGPQKDATDNMNLLLSNLIDHQERAAQFRAVIALIIDDKEYLFEGIVKGQIAKIISPQSGFGYDPIFIPVGYDKPFSELPLDVKLSLSHRSRALEKMFTFLESI